jgi:hypothetical protein
MQVFSAARDDPSIRKHNWLFPLETDNYCNENDSENQREGDV